jgi:hypothetical protein
MRLVIAMLSMALLAPTGCGSSSPLEDAAPAHGAMDSAISDAPPADAAPGHGGDAAPDTTFHCNPMYACSDCLDNDADGSIDGFDPQCTAPFDAYEDSFATGVMHEVDNRSDQECFFDGDIGAGNDGCDVHTCCLLETCPAELQAGWDPSKTRDEQCPVSELCTAVCEPLAVAGCDCFGCCTMCRGADCHDVYVNMAVAPDCTFDAIGDPSRCPACILHQDCARTCDSTRCILCPGQTRADLPPSCTDPQCGDGQQRCLFTAECPAGHWCSQGCCVEHAAEWVLLY